MRRTSSMEYLPNENPEPSSAAWALKRRTEGSKPLLRIACISSMQGENVTRMPIESTFTNVPLPWRRDTTPSAARLFNACRMVVRLTPSWDASNSSRGSLLSWARSMPSMICMIASCARAESDVVFNGSIFPSRLPFGRRPS